MNDATINLRSMREDAGISQTEMGNLLECSQGQVSRYEDNPDDAPYSVVRKWISICKVNPQAWASNETPLTEGLDVGTPYKDLREKIDFVKAYAKAAPPAAASEESPATIEDFLANLRVVGRKPRLAICGHFDAGKSRMANTLMGVESLPTDFQPTTNVVCLIRHTEDRPDWIQEDVWILTKDEKSSFDFTRASDREYCEKNKLFGGTYDTLAKFSSNNPSHDEKAFAALVFINSPLLLGCDLIDLPGYGNTDHNQADHEKAEFGQRFADALVYASTAQGFLDKHDLIYINGLLKQLRTFETPDNGLAPLCNVHFVATMARMDADKRAALIAKAATRAFRHLKECLESRATESGVAISEEAFASRFFPFLVEKPDLRKPFSDDLARLLKDAIPPTVIQTTNQTVARWKDAAKRDCDARSAHLVVLLEERERKVAELAARKQAEPERKQRAQEGERAILKLVELNRQSSELFIGAKIPEFLRVESIEEVIRAQYGDNKKDAQSLAGAFICEQVSNRVNEHIKTLSSAVADEVSRFVKDYQESAEFKFGGGVGEQAVPFNAEGIFLGAIAGLGTMGALAVWAAVVAAGSNLGGYLLVGSIVSSLSAMGISVGGTAAVFSAVSAIGGPVTIMIALGVLTAIAVFGFFGPTWQTRLARKIAEEFESKGFLKSLESQTDSYWSATRDGVLVACRKMEEAFQAYLSRLENDLDPVNTEEVIRERIRAVEEKRDFLAGIPWAR